MTHTPGVHVHLPCPPLREWLPVLLASKRVAAWDPSRAPRQVRAVLLEWPQIGGSDEDADEGSFNHDPTSSSSAELDVLVFGVSLERPAPPEQCLAKLRSGALIVELAVPRRRVLRQLLGLDPGAQLRATSGQSRALQWLARGCFELEQWESVEPPEVVVTLARVRR